MSRPVPAGDATRVETAFGAFDLETDEIITLPAGLPGFEECRLQSVEGPSASFLAIDPRVSKDAVSLGVTAPADVPVHRQEVYDQIREENRRAAAPARLPAALTRLVKQPDGAS